ncbi:MAG: hypothetical protein EZS28_027101, partial [Streblomastix strix]
MQQYRKSDDPFNFSPNEMDQLSALLLKQQDEVAQKEHQLAEAEKKKATGPISPSDIGPKSKPKSKTASKLGAKKIVDRRTIWTEDEVDNEL